MIYSLRPWVRGDKFSAKHLDECPTVLRAIAPLMATGRASHITGLNGTSINVPEDFPYLDIRQGIIVDSQDGSGDDHFDERYFVKFANVKPTGIRKFLEFKANPPQKIDDKYQETFPVTVTNLVEEKARTHFLRTDGTRVVTIFGFWDSKNSKHWVMSEQPEFLVAILTDTGPSGEADFTDHRYWAKLAYVSNDSTDPSTANTYEVLQIPVDPNAPGGEAGDKDYTAKKVDFIVKIENLAEKVDGTHNLAVDETVVVQAFYQLDDSKNGDGDPDPVLRYWTIFGGAAKAGLFPVLVDVDGGTNALSATGPATYTYAVTDLNGNPLGDHMTPNKKRPAGKITIGNGVGTGFNAPDGTFVLFDADEVKSFGPCATS